MKIIVGDFNAKIGKDECYKQYTGKHSLHAESSDNGVRLINFAASKNLVVGSTMFQRKDIHKATWHSPDGSTNNQIDHLLIDSRHYSNLMGVRTYRGANVDSDHYLVGAVVRARIAKTREIHPSNSKRFELKALENPQKVEEFQTIITNKLLEGNEQALSERWNKCSEAITDAAQRVLGDQRKEVKKIWFDEACREATRKKNEAYKALQQRTRTRQGMERSTASMKDAYGRLEEAAKRIGLLINEKKSKVMVAGGSGALGTHEREALIEINGKHFEIVEEFIYLGSSINAKNDTSRESQTLSRKTKLMLYQTIILPVLLYGSETWAQTLADEKMLGVFERKILRRIFGGVQESGAWRRRHNEELYRLYQHADVVTLM
ncbi:uncharacterized protein LOC120354665 [Nilaparvata lugens]|uniref:uncharacterized protein LOC120354665 n=1 Tax=Nilaparvata lugens TaxID=108931 RepID=UPI00193E4932|nr:uncharacterized protein LOC120354665 [Nilaparvata lugens]